MNGSGQASLLPARDRLDGIQVLRSVAILAVLAQHLSLSGTLFKDLLPNIAMPFYSGVELFFIISGFVVSRSLSYSNFSPIPFAFRRIFRLYPPIFFFFLISFIQILLIQTYVDNEFLREIFGSSINTFFSQSISIIFGTLINRTDRIIWANSAMWSLSVEFQFYFGVFATVVVFYFTSRRVYIEKIFFACCAFLYIVSIAYRILGYHTNFDVEIMNYIIAFKFDFLLLGVSLFALERFSLLKRAAFSAGWLSALAIAAAFVVLALARAPLTPVVVRHDLEGYPMVIAGLCFAAALWLSLSVGAVAQENPNFLKRLMILIGDRSYTIYLLHYPCLAVIWLAIVKIDISIAADPALRYYYGLWQAVGLLALCGLLTEFSYRSVEKPTIAAGQRLMRRLRG